MSRPIRFAFYGRVSTEDQQDPAASRAWQMRRAEGVIAAHGEVVCEYFDLGVSRSQPWRERPQAAALLDAMKRPDREFDAIVIGEPQRAFYGNQYGMTFPVLVHWRVPLWVPEVQGPIDPDSEAHDMMMMMFAGMSKAERTRIKIRVRTAMESQAATEGRYLGGRPPYGYLLADQGAHPNPSKARDGKRLRQLAPDPITAPIVARIFHEYVHDHKGYKAIAQSLTDDGIPSPSAYDPDRNPHRTGAHGAWSLMSVRAILGNPRYLGHQTWGRTRGREVLRDPDDVGRGHVRRQEWTDASEWITSGEMVHEALIAPETFAAAQRERTQGRGRSTDRRPRNAKRVYILRGMIFCRTCGRRMEADQVHGNARYRCRLSSGEYARNAALDHSHPRSAQVREDRLLAPIDEWFAEAFQPKQLTKTIRALLDHEPDPAAEVRGEAARRVMADCDRKLARHRAALESGADPVIVTEWMAETRAARAVAERELIEATPPQPLSDAELAAVVKLMGNLAPRLAVSDPAKRAKAYDALGVRIYYTPGEDRIEVTVRPPLPQVSRHGGRVRVEGGT